VVGCFLGDHYVVRMRLAQTRPTDACELRIILHVFDRGSSGVAHRLAQTTHHLVDQGTEHTFVGDTSLDAFSDDLRLVRNPFLEVAIFAVAALFHGTDRTHATIVFEALTT